MCFKSKPKIKPPVEKSIICPFCRRRFDFLASETPPSKCDLCQQPFPLEYKLRYEEAVPIFIQIIGWSEAGKTTYLKGLTLALRNLIAERYSIAPLNDRTYSYVQEVLEWEEGGTQEDSTPRTSKDQFGGQAYLLLLENLPRWGSRTLVTRDVPGEIFNRLKVSDDNYYLPYLKEVATVFLMIDLIQLKTNRGRSLDDLLNNYINTLIDQGVDLKSKSHNVIVVLSKADKYHRDLPSNLRNYLSNDPISKLVNMKLAHARHESEAEDYHKAYNAAHFDERSIAAYMDEMGRVSKEIEEWLTWQPDYRIGANFMRSRASTYNIHLEYTMISSTGKDADSNGYLINPSLFRVVNPFFWALEMQSN